MLWISTWALLQLLMTWWIRRTKLCTGLVAIREDETKGATIGINLPVEKIIAFAASAVIVGMAGGVYGYYLTFIDPRGMFNILLSVQAVLSLLVGGNTRLLLFGGLLIVIALLLPQGVLPAVESLLEWLRTRGKAGLVGARIGSGGSLTSLTDRVELVDRADLPDRPLLEVKDLRKAFGGLEAVDGASFAVPEGSITGLIGPNGSGRPRSST